MPGSHKWNMRRAPDLSPESDEWAPAIMPKGSVIIYLSHTLHSGGENRTDGTHFPLPDSLLAQGLFETVAARVSG